MLDLEEIADDWPAPRTGQILDSALISSDFVLKEVD